MNAHESRKIKVLVAEDSLTYRRILEKILCARPNFVVEITADGQEAINKFAMFKPQLVLTDIEMPNVDGISLTKHLRSIDSSIKVIVLSSLGFESKVKEALTAGAQAFIVKPYDEKKVLEVVDRVVRTIK